MPQPLLDYGTRRARSYTAIRGSHERVAEEEAARSPLGRSIAPHRIRGATAFLTGCHVLYCSQHLILSGCERSMRMLPYVAGSRLQFIEFYLHPRERCGKQLTQVRKAKLCLQSGIGASIKRTVAPRTSSRTVPVYQCPLCRSGSQSTRLRVMKSVWVNTWR
jgi:hypothetical protein